MLPFISHWQRVTAKNSVKGLFIQLYLLKQLFVNNKMLSVFACWHKGYDGVISVLISHIPSPFPHRLSLSQVQESWLMSSSVWGDDSWSRYAQRSIWRKKERSEELARNHERFFKCLNKMVRRPETPENKKRSRSCPQCDSAAFSQLSFHFFNSTLLLIL